METWKNQPNDWMEPGLYPIAEGVYRIALPLPLKDLSVVNSYLFVSGSDVILIDPGFASTETERLLTQALGQLGLSWEDVGRTISTHTHWDHYSQAVALRDKYKIPVSIGTEEHHTVDAESLNEGYFSRQLKRLHTCGAVLLAQEVEQLPAEPHEIGVPFGIPDSYLKQDDRIALGDRELIIHETPGHTRGHVIIQDPANGLQVTGDHILPRITPSLGLELRPEAFPLTSFMSSLHGSLQLPDAVMLPAHGSVTGSVHARAKELLAHHQERLDAITNRVEAGSSTALEIAVDLRWTRRERTLDEMSPVHQMMAVLEVAAHLDTLTLEGLLRDQEIDQISHYAIA